MYDLNRTLRMGVLLTLCAWPSAAAAQDEPYPDVAPSAYVVLVSGPTVAGASVVVMARVSNATELRARLLVGEREIATTATPVSPGSRVAVQLTLHPDEASRATLAQTGVLRVRLVLEATANGLAAISTLTHATTLVSRPRRSFQRTGRARAGGFGSQLLRGTSLGDLLQGDSGNDEIFGRGGADNLFGGTGNDRLHGGSGGDLLDGDDGDDVLLGGPGDDQLVERRFGRDTIDGGPGDDWIDGARGVDVLRGGPGDDVLLGGPARDRYDCGPGDDVALLNLQSERANLHDCETVLDEPDFVIVACRQGGTDGPETLLGTSGPDTCEGRGGDDDLEGAGGNDRLFGGDGDDRIFGRFGNDLMLGNAGDDEIEGGRGEDTLRGGPGEDQLNGGFASDSIDGGAGDDRIIARGGGGDRIDCGPGHDIVFVDSSDRISRCEDVRRTR